jgi:hypothetical protein
VERYMSDTAFDNFRNYRITQLIDTEYNMWWWLRTPGGRNIYTAGVGAGGTVRYSGFTTTREDGGVRPAMWVTLE